MKMFHWLGKTVISTLLICSITVVTTWFVVNLYIEEIFRQYQLPALSKKVQFSDLTARLSENLKVVNPGDKDPAKDTTAARPSPMPNTAKEQEPKTTISPTTSASPTANQPVKAEDKQKDDAVAVWGHVEQNSVNNKDAAELKREVVMSTEEFTKKKELLTGDDKLKIFSLVVSKLPQAQVQHLSTLLEDGITAEELKEVEQVLLTHLKEDEYQQLMNIISKY
ncbi:hypothetical protein D3C73_525340 [compost metagenome]